MDFKTPVLVLKAAFDAVNGRGWTYSERAHNRAMERFDDWMGKLAARLPKAATKKHYSDATFHSPVEITSRNWYNYPAMRQALDAQREKTLDAATSLGRAVDRASGDRGLGILMAFSLLRGDQPLPEGSGIYSRPGYLALRKKCDEHGLILTLKDTRDWLDERRFGLTLKTDREKLPFDTSVAQAAAKPLSATPSVK
jgi:hypothetical protein